MSASSGDSYDLESPGKKESKQPQQPEFCTFGILAELIFVERWIGALQVRPRFRTVKITQ